MIVRERPSAVRLLLTLRGSVLQEIWQPLLFAVAVAVAVTASEGRVLGHTIRLDVAPFSLIGMTLAIFLGFRNNVCYERYREGRQLWGTLVVAARNLARQSLTLLSPPEAQQHALHARMLHRIGAFAHALRHELRDSDPRPELEALLDPTTLERVLAARSPAQRLLVELATELQACRRQGWLEVQLVRSLDEQLNQLSEALSGCERIKHTPVPFAYTLLMHRTIFIYCVLVPFGLLDSVGALTPLIAAVLAYTFFGLDAVGTQIEEPFGTLPNDLPLAGLCRTLEIDLRQLLGESPLPEPLQPVDFILH